jgi:SAM-dependent methyltransferase
MALRPPWPVECVVASLSLHHVADLDQVLDRLGALLVPGGTLVVVAWAWERFDEPTARWCFEHLAPPAPGTEPGWLPTHEAEERAAIDAGLIRPGGIRYAATRP